MLNILMYVVELLYIDVVLKQIQITSVKRHVFITHKYAQQNYYSTGFC